MSEMLAVPLKKPSEVDVVKPLRNLVQSSYSAAASTNAAGGTAATGADKPAPDYIGVVQEFGKLRNTAIWKFYDKYESSLDVVYR